MGKNPCALCATPGVRIKNGEYVCVGCGETPLRLVAQYLKRNHMPITLDLAAAKYMRLNRGGYGNKSFGHWLVCHNFELIGKP